MVLGAYDSTHVDASGVAKPWGVLNWWSTAPTQLTWFEDKEFQDMLNNSYIGRGDNNTVVVTN